MQLFSESMRKILQVSIRWAHFLRIIPFEWDRKNELIRLSSSRAHVKCWTGVVYLILIHQVFVSVRLCQSILAQQETFSFYCILVAYYLAFILLFICQFFFFLKKTEWVQFMNWLIRFCNKFDGNSSTSHFTFTSHSSCLFIFQSFTQKRKQVLHFGKWNSNWCFVLMASSPFLALF